MEGKGKKRTERRAVRKKINKRNKEEGSNRGEGDEYKNKKITSWGEEAGDADRSEAEWWVNDLNFDPMETCVIKKKSFTSYKLLLTTTLWLEILSLSGFCLQATIFVGKEFFSFFFTTQLVGELPGRTGAEHRTGLWQRRPEFGLGNKKHSG